MNGAVFVKARKPRNFFKKVKKTVKKRLTKRI